MPTKSPCGNLFEISISNITSHSEGKGCDIVSQYFLTLLKHCQLCKKFCLQARIFNERYFLSNSKNQSLLYLSQGGGRVFKKCIKTCCYVLFERHLPRGAIIEGSKVVSKSVSHGTKSWGEQIFDQLFFTNNLSAPFIEALITTFLSKKLLKKEKYFHPSIKEHFLFDFLGAVKMHFISVIFEWKKLIW